MMLTTGAYSLAQNTQAAIFNRFFRIDIFMGEMIYKFIYNSDARMSSQGIDELTDG
jgi:hypothetical protein